MKLSEILDFQLNEMANLRPTDTGLEVAVWLGKVGGQHGPRIKVCNIRGKYDDNDTFTMSVSKNPEIVTPKSVRLKTNDVEEIEDWIILN